MARLNNDDQQGLSLPFEPGDLQKAKKANTKKKTVNKKEKGSGKAKPSAVDPSLQPARPSTLYLPVSQLRAQVFLAQGLIFPAHYDSAAAPPIIDEQSRDPGVLTLWREPPAISKKELLLGVSLMPEEEHAAGRNEDALVLARPLPVSRLVEIAVPISSDADVAKYVSGWIVPDVPVPRALFKRAEKVEDAIQAHEGTFSDGTGRPMVDSSGIQQALGKYDRIMGMFAYMRNAARFHSARLGVYADYPAQLFRLAGLLNSSLDLSRVPDVKLSPLLHAVLTGKPTDDRVVNEFLKIMSSTDIYLNKQDAKNLSRVILEDCCNDADVQSAFDKLFDEDYKAAIRFLQERKPGAELALLASVLFKFSDRQANDHRNIKQALHTDFVSVPAVATILGMMGAYYGYTALDARESRLYSVDRELADCVDPQPPIKFHLESRFERGLIEAIYQWAFNGRKYEPPLTATFESLGDQRMPPMPPAWQWKDDSYEVQDLRVRNFRLTLLARLLRRIEEIPSPYIDETTPLGQYLMFNCFFHADEADLSFRQGHKALHYRISKQRLFKLFAEGAIKINIQVLETAINETMGRK